MKRVLFLVFAVFPFSMVTFGQHWVDQRLGWSAPERGVQNICIVTPDVVWASAYDASTAADPVQDFAVSMNGGASWFSKTVSNAAGLGISMISAIDAQHAWACMYYGSGTNLAGIYWTRNRGMNWERTGTAGMFTSGTSFPDVVYFWDINTGVAIGDPVNNKFEIYTSTDSVTWVPVTGLPDADPGETAISSNYNVMGSHIWFGTSSGHIYHSPDQGHSWTVGTPDGMTGQNIWPAMVTADTGFAIKYYSGADTTNLLYRTDNGGATYTAAAYTGQLFNGELRSIYYNSPTSYLAASGADRTLYYRNGMVYSFDNGASFAAVDPDLSGIYITAHAWSGNGVAWAGVINSGPAGGIKKLTAQVVPAVSDFIAKSTELPLHGSVIFGNTSTGIETEPCTYSWTFQGGTPSTSTLKVPPTITYDSPGLFDVSLKVTNAFGSISNRVKTGYIHVGGAGIDELSPGALMIYPNPVKGTIHIQSGSVIQQIQIFNTMGQLMISRQTGSKSVSLETSSLKPGIYFLKVTLDGKVFDQKITVQ